jgi:hydroxymethylpyrimidine pyrophosphatase-like HAD family hydrolase
MLSCCCVHLKDIHPSKLRWYFDYDGTLCPHQEVWEERAYNPSDIALLLQELQAAGSAVFWNTGRRPESLFSVHPEFSEFSGYFVHGSVYWEAESKSAHYLCPQLPQHVVEQTVELVEGRPEFSLEVKPTAMRVVAKKSADAKLLESWVSSLPVEEWGEWVWNLGHRGYEILHRGYSKKKALERDASTHLHGDKIPVALGDDVFDAGAVEAAVKASGYGFAVGDHCAWVTTIPHRPQHLIFCESPKSVHAWIRSWLSNH